jgi:cation transport regulator ChaB
MPYNSCSSLPKIIRKNMLNTDRKFIGKLSIVHRKNMKNLLKGGDASREETLTRSPGVWLRKHIKTIQKETWQKRRINHNYRFAAHIIAFES